MVLEWFQKWIERVRPEIDARLRELEPEIQRHVEEELKKKGAELETGYAAKFEEEKKRIRSEIEAELSRTYAERLRESARVPELEEKVRGLEAQHKNLHGLVDKARDTLTPLYDEISWLVKQVSADSLRIVRSYAARDLELPLGLLAKMQGEGVRLGYATKFFQTLDELHQYLGDSDLLLMRTLLSANWSVEEMRAASLRVLNKVKAHETLGAEGREEYVQSIIQRRINLDEWRAEAVAEYSRDEKHRDFYAGLTNDERDVLHVSREVYLDNWAEYCEDLDSSVAGAKEVEPRVFQERRIVQFLMDYEKKHSIRLKDYVTVA